MQKFKRSSVIIYANKTIPGMTLTEELNRWLTMADTLDAEILNIVPLPNPQTKNQILIIYRTPIKEE